MEELVLSIPTHSMRSHHSFILVVAASITGHTTANRLHTNRMLYSLTLNKYCSPRSRYTTFFENSLCPTSFLKSSSDDNMTS